MKKYLIIVMAFVTSYAFVSCHDDELGGSIIEQKKQTFEAAFIKAFGQPDPTHNWGFRMRETEGVTRGEIDANGNMWVDAPTYGPTERHHEVDGVIVPGDIYNYVNRVADGTWNYGTSFPVNLRNYYVSQIFEGDATYKTYQTIMNNGTATFVGSDNMDYLIIADKTPSTINKDPGTLDAESSWFHIYDFNSANNSDYDGHMRVRNAGTLNFAYWNSLDSKFHDKWIAVDGADINEKYKDYWYICFDFEAQPKSASDNFTNISFEYPFDKGNGEIDYRQANLQLPGAWTIDFAKKEGIVATVNHEGTELTFPVGSEQCKNWRVTQVSKGDKLVPGDDIYTDWIIRITKAEPQGLNISAPQVWKTETINVTNGRVKKEIVTGQRVVESGRVMCEDLAGATGNLDDLDYNDVVYDAIIVNEYRKLVTTTYDGNNQVLSVTKDSLFTGLANQANGYYKYFATVRLMAAGGTIPVTMTIGKNNFDVHDKLGGNPSSVMINTLPRAERADVNMAEVTTADPVTLTDKNGSEKFYDIEYISDIKLHVLYENVATELVDSFGAATYKFLVPLGLPWAKVRKPFGEVYPHFEDWVHKKENEIWYYEKRPSLLYEELEGLTIPANFETEVTTAISDLPISSSVTTKEKVDATSPFVTPTATETVVYNFATPNGPGPGYLCPEVTTADGLQPVENVSVTGFSGLQAGDVIRVYGVSIDGWEVNCVYSTTDKKAEYASANCGYFEIPIDEEQAAYINNHGLRFSGKRFTITFVTVYRANTGEGSGEGSGTGEGAGEGSGEGSGTGEGTGEGSGTGEGTGEGSGTGTGGETPITILSNGSLSFNAYGNTLNGADQIISCDFDFNNLSNSPKIEVEFTRDARQYDHEPILWELKVCTYNGTVFNDGTKSPVAFVSDSDGGSDANGTAHNSAVGTSFREVFNVSSDFMPIWRMHYNDWNQKGIKILGKSITVTKITIIP